MNTMPKQAHVHFRWYRFLVVVSDPHAVDQFIDKTPFDILTNDDYESNVNALFGCTLEVQ